MSNASINEESGGSKKVKSGFSFDNSRSVKSEELKNLIDESLEKFSRKNVSSLIAQVRQKLESSEKTVKPVLSQVKNRFAEGEKVFTDALGKSKKVVSEVKQKALGVNPLNLVALAKKTLTERIRGTVKK